MRGEKGLWRPQTAQSAGRGGKTVDLLHLGPAQKGRNKFPPPDKTRNFLFREQEGSKEKFPILTFGAFSLKRWRFAQSLKRKSPVKKASLVPMGRPVHFLVLFS